jgi:hypothetical protein
MSRILYKIEFEDAIWKPVQESIWDIMYNSVNYSVRGPIDVILHNLLMRSVDHSTKNLVRDLVREQYEN